MHEDQIGIQLRIKDSGPDFFYLPIFQAALFLPRFEVHRVQRCNRNFTLVQDNSKSLYPPLSWESFENAFVTFAKVISSAPAFIFIEASLHALGDKKQHTELTLQLIIMPFPLIFVFSDHFTC